MDVGKEVGAGTIVVLALVSVGAGTGEALCQGFEPYVRAGLGVSFSSDAVFVDRDCAASDPAALFGCGDGPDGRPIAARGDFGSSALFEGAVGTTLNSWARVEAVLGYRPFLEFQGNANFQGVALDQQPVGADATSLTGMLAGFVDLATLAGFESARVRPYVGGAFGIAHNTVDEVVYRFPSLGAGSETVTQSGSSTEFAWALEGGLELALTGNLFAGVAYRYADLGRVRTDPGDILVVREGGNAMIPVGETRAELDVQEVLFTMRKVF